MRADCVPMISRSLNLPALLQMTHRKERPKTAEAVTNLSGFQRCHAPSIHKYFRRGPAYLPSDQIREFPAPKALSGGLAVGSGRVLLGETAVVPLNQPRYPRTAETENLRMIGLVHLGVIASARRAFGRERLWNFEPLGVSEALSGPCVTAT
jgi:hypothetical protein